MAAEVHLLYQQMGEMLSNLRSLADMIAVRDEQSVRLNDLVRHDLSTLKQDQRDLEDKLNCVVCVMQNDMQMLKVGAADGARSVDELVKAVQELRSPVAEIVALRSRAAGLIFGLGIFGSAVLWLAEPVYRWFVDQHYLAMAKQ